MLNRLELSIRPNNQITLTIGNYRHVREIYKDIPTIEAGYGKKERMRLAREIAKEKKRNEPKYSWRNGVFAVHATKRSSPLVIIRKSQRKSKACRLNKPKSFTNAAGQKLRECGSAIDQICGDPTKTVAITLTLPAHHEDAFRAIAAYSGYAVNRLFQPIRRNYGDEVLWFFVWEYQKRGALHMHIALYHHEKSRALEIGRSLRGVWWSILQDIGKLADTDMFLGRRGRRNDDIEKMHFYCEPMRRSLGAYFSKYAGKNESKQAWYCQRYPVGRFWGSCYALKKLVKELSFSFVLEIDDSDHIEHICALILERLSKKDISLQSNYHFDIKKAYDKDWHLKIAEGDRYTFYCHPKQLRSLLLGFDDLKDTF